MYIHSVQGSPSFSCEEVLPGKGREPNKSPDPTTGAVTPRAGHEGAPACGRGSSLTLGNMLWHARAAFLVNPGTAARSLPVFTHDPHLVVGQFA